MAKNSKPWYKSTTIYFGGLLVGLGLWRFFKEGNPDAGIELILMGGGFIGLRNASTPVRYKKPTPEG